MLVNDILLENLDFWLLEKSDIFSIMQMSWWIINEPSQNWILKFKINVLSI